MTRFFIKTVFLISLSWNSFAQQNVQERSFSIPSVNCLSIDSLSSYIQQNFKTDNDKTRAIYLWVTNNISYDVPRFLARDKEPKMPPQTTREVFTSKSAVCQGYSELFVELCNNAGIKAFKVSGYTKKKREISPVSHAWVAAVLDGGWFLFDPTWGAGYVRNETFVKRVTDSFYKVLPAKFIGDHMPFDPMFQLLPYPLTTREFIEGSPASGKSIFNFNDSIKQHTQLIPQLQFAAELRRMETAGIQNGIVTEHQAFLKRQLQSIESKDAFNEAQVLFKRGLFLYNQYVSYKNNRFSSITDKDLKLQIDSIELCIRSSRSLISELNPTNDKNRDSKANIIATIERFWTKFIDEQQFVEKYLATNMENRKQLFRKN